MITASTQRVEHLATPINDTIDPTTLGVELVDHFSIPALDATGKPKVEAASEIESNKQPLTGGEVLISKLNPRKARVVLVPESSRRRMLCSGEFIVLRPDACEPRFLAYVLQSELVRQKLDAAVNSVTRSHQRVRPEILTKMDVWAPPLAEQRAIADYLDAETARIDALITKKQQLIHLLDERANSEIMAIVGRSELVRASGAERLPLKRLAERRIEWAQSGEMITAFRDGQVTTRSLRGREGFTNSWTEGARVQIVQLGDAVVHGLDGFSGAIGDAEVDGVCSPVYHVLSSIEGDNTFLGRLLRLLAMTGYLSNFATSTRERAVDFRNWDLFGSIPIPVVEPLVQRSIGDQIRGIRPLRKLFVESSRLALEKRQALITRTVTGELDFRGPGA